MSVTLLGCGRYFDPELREAKEKANQVLAAHQLCPMDHDCPNGEVMFAETYRGGVKVEIWGVTDDQTAQELSAIYKEEFSKTPDMGRLEIQTYSTTHHAALAGNPRNPDWVYSIDAKPVTDVILEK